MCGQYLSLEETCQEKKLDRFVKEHPSKVDEERFEKLLIVKPRPWNTGRLALYGAFGGVAFAVIRNWAELGNVSIAEGAGLIAGGAVGGAVIVATISGLRNVIIGWSVR